MRRKKLRSAITGALLILMTGALAGCGKKEIDVMEGIEVEFSGVDGYGTARIADEYVFEDAALEAAGLTEKMDSDFDDEAIGTLQGVYTIEEAVKYEVSPSENLSNGDVVTVTASINNESVEDFKIQFTGTEMKFTVEGLKEVEQIDLFQGVEVEFEGFAPYVKATINRQNARQDVYVSFSIDKSENLTMGDTVTVTAEYDEAGLLQKGYIAKESTKEFTVDECDRYVTQLTEIPEDTVSKMNKQFEDAFRSYVASVWSNPDTLNSIEYVGNYLLTAKEGSDTSNKNIYYGIYKISVSTEDEDFEYYSYCQFKNLIILKDGTCSVDLSDYTMPKGSTFFGRASGEAFSRGGPGYTGYEELDSLFSNCVTKNIEKYEYESNVTE